MADENEDLEVVLGGDSDDAVVERAAGAVITPEDGIEVLRRQLEEETNRRRQAEERASKAEKTAYEAQVDKHDTDLHLIESAISELERNNIILVQGISAANAEGDYQKAAELTAELTQSQTNLNVLKDGKEKHEKIKVEPPKRVGSDDAVEDFARQLTFKSAEWVRKHPECITDPKLYKKMLAAHQSAVDIKDFKPDTPEYFAHLDETMGYAEKPLPVATDVDNPLSSAASSAAVEEAPRVAPVSNGGGGSKTRVTLTAAEKEMAELVGQTPEQYAKNKLALIKEGRLTTH